MKGKVRSQVQKFFPDASGECSIQVPFLGQHVFEVQFFFSNKVRWSFGPKGFAPNTRLNQSVDTLPSGSLRFYCHPDFARTDTFLFVCDDPTPGRAEIIAVFSYVDN